MNKRTKSIIVRVIQILVLLSVLGCIMNLTSARGCNGQSSWPERPADSPGEPSGEIKSHQGVVTGHVNLPRGYTLYIGLRSSLGRCSHFDMPFELISLPSDFPSPSCRIDFQAEMGAGKAASKSTWKMQRSWKAISPPTADLVGSTGGGNGFEFPLDFEIRDVTLMNADFGELLRNKKTQYQRLRIATWKFKRKDGESDYATLEIWMAPEAKIITQDLFLPPDSSPWSPLKDITVIQWIEKRVKNKR